MKLTKNTIIDEMTFKKGCDLSIHSVIDNYDNTCSVFVSINSTTVDAVRGIGLMDYAETWDDEDIINFIKLKTDAQ